jgi:hypothetical protein
LIDFLLYLPPPLERGVVRNCEPIPVSAARSATRVRGGKVGAVDDDGVWPFDRGGAVPAAINRLDGKAPLPSAAAPMVASSGIRL